MDSSPLNKSKNNTLKGLLSLVVLAVIIFTGLYSIQSRYALLNQQQVNQQPNPITPLPANEDLSKKQHLWNVNIKIDTKTQKYTIAKIQEKSGYIPDYLNQPDQGYTLKIFNSQNKELFSLKFLPPTIFTQSLGPIQQSQLDILTPALDDAKTIEILDPKNSLIDARTIKQNKKTSLNFSPVKLFSIPKVSADEKDPNAPCKYPNDDPSAPPINPPCIPVAAPTPNPGPPLSNECPDIPGITNCSTGAYSCPSYFPTCVGGCGMDSHGCSNIGSPPNPPDIPVEPEQPTPPALPPSEIPVVPEATQATSPTPANNQANNCSQIVPNTNEDVTKCNSLPGCKYIYCPSSHSVCAPADTQTRPLQNSDFPGLPLAPSYPGGTNDAVCSGSGSIPQGSSNPTGTGSQTSQQQGPGTSSATSAAPITIVPKSNQCKGQSLNLFFIGENFSTDDEFKTEAKKFVDKLTSSPPYNLHSEIIAAGGVRVNGDPGGCFSLINTRPQPPAGPLTCNTFIQAQSSMNSKGDRCKSFLNSTASQYPHDIIISLGKGTAYNELAAFPPESFIVAGNAFDGSVFADHVRNWQAMTSDKGFVHEMGHAFGNFLDQYTAVPPQLVQQCPQLAPQPQQFVNSKNCAKTPQEGSAWTQKYGVQPVQGCFRSDWYRSTNDQSIMMTDNYNWTGALHYDQVEDDLLKPSIDNYVKQCKGQINTPQAPQQPGSPQAPGQQTPSQSSGGKCQVTSQNSVKDASGKVWLSPTCDATTIQGCNGPFTHQGQTAVDFQNPQGACGATVYAPIDAVYQPYTESPTGDHGCKFQYNGNTYILTHFKAQSCNGQLVHQGEPIGVEGCSGLATFKPGGGPCHVHLGPHFYSNHQAPNPFCSVAQNTYGSLPNTNQTDGCFY